MRCFAQTGAGILQKDINHYSFASIIVLGRLIGKKIHLQANRCYSINKLSLCCYKSANPLMHETSVMGFVQSKHQFYLYICQGMTSQQICWVSHTDVVSYFFAEEYLQVDFDKATFAVSAVLHPSTYLNKILLGSEQGSLQLWNIRSK